MNTKLSIIILHFLLALPLCNAVQVEHEQTNIADIFSTMIDLIDASVKKTVRKQQFTLSLRRTRDDIAKLASLLKDAKESTQEILEETSTELSKKISLHQEQKQLLYVPDVIELSFILTRLLKAVEQNLGDKKAPIKELISDIIFATSKDLLTVSVYPSRTWMQHINKTVENTKNLVRKKIEYAHNNKWETAKATFHYGKWLVAAYVAARWQLANNAEKFVRFRETLRNDVQMARDIVTGHQSIKNLIFGNYSMLGKKVDFDTDIHGYDTLKKRMKKIAEFLQDPEKRKSLPKNILLVGPPGTGKTKFIQAVSTKASDIPFIAISGPDLDSWRLPLVFQEAYKRAPSIIFIDELSRAREDMSNALLTKLDGIQTRHDKPVFVFAAANHPQDLSSALRQRFTIIEVGKPDEASREAIFKHLLEEITADTTRNITVSIDNYDTIVTQSADMSGRMITKAVTEALNEMAFGDKKELTEDILVESLKKLQKMQHIVIESNPAKDAAKEKKR